MRVFRAAAILMLLGWPAYAQNPTPDKPKTPQDIAAEKEAEKAYQRSLGNIPDKSPTDPWGTVRSGDAPKQPAKAASGKRTKADTAAK